MQTSSPRLTILALLGVCAAFCAVSTSAFANSQTAEPPQMRLCSFTHDLVYLTTPTGSVDVTRTLYTSQGVTYVVYQGTPLAVVLNDTDLTVKDTTGVVIGFIKQVVEGYLQSVPQTLDVMHQNVVRRTSRTLRYSIPSQRSTFHSKQKAVAMLHDLA